MFIKMDSISQTSNLYLITLKSNIKYVARDTTCDY